MIGEAPGPALRPIGAFDLELLGAMHAACFEDCWSASAFASLLSAPGALGFIADRGGQPAGLILARVAAGEAEILTIGVLPEHRGAGVGAALLGRVDDALEARGVSRLFLEVAEDNAAARALYARHGFQPVGRRHGYYARKGGPAVAALVLLREGRTA